MANGRLWARIGLLAMLPAGAAASLSACMVEQAEPHEERLGAVGAEVVAETEYPVLKCGGDAVYFTVEGTGVGTGSGDTLMEAMEAAVTNAALLAAGAQYTCDFCESGPSAGSPCMKSMRYDPATKGLAGAHVVDPSQCKYSLDRMEYVCEFVEVVLTGDPNGPPTVVEGWCAPCPEEPKETADVR